MAVTVVAVEQVAPDPAEARFALLLLSWTVQGCFVPPISPMRVGISAKGMRVAVARVAAFARGQAFKIEPFAAKSTR